MLWTRLFSGARQTAPAPCLGIPSDPAAPIDLRKFERFTAAEVQALPRRLRREVIAYRKAEKTAALESFVAAR